MPETAEIGWAGVWRGRRESEPIRPAQREERWSAADAFAPAGWKAACTTPGEVEEGVTKRAVEVVFALTGTKAVFALACEVLFAAVLRMAPCGAPAVMRSTVPSELGEALPLLLSDA